MTRLIRAQCVQNLLRRSNHKSSCWIKHLLVKAVPSRERKFIVEGPLRSQSATLPGSGIILLRKTWRPGRKLLVLGLGGKAAMGLGVVDDFAEQFLAERGQRALPQFPRGFAFPDEAPLLDGDGAGIHAVGEMV